jgi:hypothetical protein
MIDWPRLFFPSGYINFVYKQLLDIHFKAIYNQYRMYILVFLF